MQNASGQILGPVLVLLSVDRFGQHVPELLAAPRRHDERRTHARITFAFLPFRPKALPLALQATGFFRGLVVGVHVGEDGPDADDVGLARAMWSEIRAHLIGLIVKPMCRRVLRKERDRLWDCLFRESEAVNVTCVRLDHRHVLHAVERAQQPSDIQFANPLGRQFVGSCSACRELPEIVEPTRFRLRGCGVSG